MRTICNVHIENKEDKAFWDGYLVTEWVELSALNIAVCVFVVQYMYRILSIRLRKKRLAK